jgi:hypothetical protein
MRKLTCCIALVLMLCLSGAAFAQTMPPTFCGELSQEDCDILTNASTATATLDSALYDFTFDLNVSNVPDMDEPLNFNITGSGSFSGMAALHDSMMGMMDTTAIQADPTMMMQMVGDLFRGLNADINLNFNFPPALVEQMGDDMPDTLTIQARLVDGFGYLNMDTLAPLIADSSMNLSGWYGIDLAGLFEALSEQMTTMMSEMPDDMTMFGMNAEMMENMAQFYDPEFIGQFVSVTRVDDGSGDTAVFQSNIDLGAMMGSPELQNMIRQQMASQMEMMGGEAMDEADIDEALAMTTQMFKGMTFVVTEEIGLTDGFIHRVNGAMSFDTAGMMAAMGETSSSGDVPPVINLTFSIGYSSFNTAPPVTAPEDATIIPYQSLLSGMDMSEMEMTPTMTATTGVATAVPTADGTSEATVEPTDAPTSEVTSEPSAEPTDEATVEVPPVPTLEPTEEVTPAA